MQEKSFSKLLASIKEAGQIKSGRKQPDRTFKIDPPSIKAVRRKLHLSQSEFALMIGVSPSTLQNWEQGRREPDGPAKALLKVASQNPEAVIKVLHA
jgi:putative transcriptional regulator